MSLVLDPDRIAMVAKGVSAIVASRDATIRPSIMRAVGSHISADGQEVTVYLRRSQSRQLLQDITATGEIAVVFSEPPTAHCNSRPAKPSSVRPTPMICRCCRPTCSPW
jgi:hypothetical protein